MNKKDNEIKHLKKTVEDLLESERMYRLLAQNAIEVIWTMDLDGNFTYISPSVEHLRGFTKEEAEKMPLEMSMTPESYSYAIETLAGYLAIDSSELPRSKTMELEQMCKDGSTVWTEVTVRMIQDDQGGLSALQGTTRDITKRREAEARLKRSEERFRMFYEQAPLAYQSLDPTGVIKEVNNAWVDLFGYKREAVRGKHFREFLAPGFEDRFNRTLVFLEKNEEFHNVELDIMTKKGAKVTVSVNAKIGLDENNDHVQSYFILYDITERKHTERAIRRRSMKFPLEEGAIYCIKEPKCVLGGDVLRDLLNVGFSATIITRDPSFKCSQAERPKIDLQWIATRGGGMPPVPKVILEHIENLTDSRAILVDCLDYLISRNDFESVLNFVQELREIAYLLGHIIIISVPGGVLPKTKMTLLESECRHMESPTQRRLSEDLYGILKFIYENNVTGFKPAYSEVQANFDMSKPTVRKKLAFLNSTGYLIEMKKGRKKLLELTEKGMGLFR